MIYTAKLKTTSLILILLVCATDVVHPFARRIFSERVELKWITIMTMVIGRRGME